MHLGPTLRGFGRDSEELRGKRIDRALVRRVLGFARPYRKLLGAFIVAVVIGAVIGAIPPLLFKALIDTAVPDKNRGMVALLAGVTVMLAVANAVLSLVQRYFSSRIGEGLIFDMRAALFDHVQRLPLSFFTRTQTGALMSRMNNDVIGAQQAITNTLGTVFSNFVSVGVTLGFMLWLDWRLTILTLLVLPAFIISARQMGPRLQAITREGMQVNATMNNTIAERFNVAGALVVKLFGRHDLERDEFAARAARVRDIGIQSAMYQRLLFTALGLVASIGTAIVYVVGGNLAISGTISIGTIGAFVVYVSQIYQPLTQLSNARVDVLTALVSFERVFEVLDFPALVADRDGSVALEHPEGRIELDHVWFRHPPAALTSIPSLEEPGAAASSEDSEWILRDVSFAVEPGELVALVGPSGAGKTTTALLVPRIYDVTAGAVRVDGHDVRDLTLGSLRGAVGMVMQDPHLFHDSIRNNLLYARDSTRPTTSSSRRAAPPASTTSSRASPTGTTPWWASAATACPAARSNGWPSPACSSRIRPSSSSTRPRRTSTPSRRSRSSGRSRPHSRAGPLWSSRTGCRPSSRRTGSWCSTRERSWRAVVTTSSCSRAASTPISTGRSSISIASRRRLHAPPAPPTCPDSIDRSRRSFPPPAESPACPNPIRSTSRVPRVDTGASGAVPSAVA